MCVALEVPRCGMMGLPVSQDDGVCMSVHIPEPGHRNHVWQARSDSPYAGACECGFIAEPKPTCADIDAQLLSHVAH